MPDFTSIAEAFKVDPGLDKLRNVIKANDVIIYFYKIFPGLAKIAEPVKNEKNILYLKIENAAWRNELKFKEKLIIDKINNFFSGNEGTGKEEVVKKIKFIS